MNINFDRVRNINFERKVDYTYKTLKETKPVKGYRFKVAYGMVSMKEQNGNVILCW